MWPPGFHQHPLSVYLARGVTVSSGSSRACLACFEHSDMSMIWRLEEIPCNEGPGYSTAYYDCICYFWHLRGGKVVCDFAVWRVLPVCNGGVLSGQSYWDGGAFIHLSAICLN